jgi:hypothetical protein
MYQVSGLPRPIIALKLPPSMQKGQRITVVFGGRRGDSEVMESALEAGRCPQLLSARPTILLVRS